MMVNRLARCAILAAAALALAACGSANEADEPAEAQARDHVLQGHQRALESAREMEAEMRERVDKLEQAIERAIDEGEPSG